jgi:hypothetical protein
MSHADYLSGNISRIALVKDQKHSWLAVAQRADEQTKDLIERVKRGELDEKLYRIHGEHLYRVITNTDGSTTQLFLFPLPIVCRCYNYTMMKTITWVLKRLLNYSRGISGSPRCGAS